MIHVNGGLPLRLEVTVPRQPDIFVSKSARIFFRFPDHFSIAQNS
jgi:hypothetical protein